MRSNIDLIEWRNCGPGNNSSLKFWACEGWFGSNETGLQCQAGFEKYVISSQPLKKQSRWSERSRLSFKRVERIMFSTGFARKVRVCEKIAHAKAQRRKALPRFKGCLCIFAPLRQTYSPHQALLYFSCKAFFDFSTGLARKVFKLLRGIEGKKIFLTQVRTGANKTLETRQRFAPLREKSSPYRYERDSLCKAFSTNCHLADIHDFRCAVSSRYSGLKVT